MNKMIGTPHSFFEFREDREVLKSLLHKAGVNYGSNHRIELAYKRIEKMSKDIESRGVTSFDGEDILMLIDLCEMNKIIKHMGSIDATTLKYKWGELIKGSISKKDETENNSDGRNVQFELLLYSIFCNKGLVCKLGTPNPDILINDSALGGVNVQCKRILNNNPKSIEKNIRKAAKQLRADHKNNGFLGIIALSVERIFSGGDSFISSHNQDSALNFVIENHTKFINQYKRLWSSKKMLGTTHIPSVIVYTSQVGLLSNDIYKFSHITQQDHVKTIASTTNTKNNQKLQNLFKIPDTR